MTPLLIIAAGGLAREVAETVTAQGKYQLHGFLDDDRSTWHRPLAETTVLGGLEVARDQPDSALLICAGKGSARAAIAARLIELGVDAQRFATVVHPSVSLPKSATVGPGTILLAGCVLTADVSIGRHVVAMPRVVLTHDNRVGDYVTLCAGVTLGGNCTVEEFAYLGMQSCVRQDVRVGYSAVLGMGAVALCDIPAAQVWVGNPARRLLAGGLPEPQGASPIREASS